ncbi:MAG: AmmeMemoRadiSam system protein A [Desulfonatronovibrionaceae bacterium]
MREFDFCLTEEEKKYLRELALSSIERELKSESEKELLPPMSGKMEEKLGVFVTLKKRGQLRGCIGNMVGDGPLWRTVSSMARAAAFEDPRFPPVSKSEFSELEIEISILSPLEEVRDFKAIVPGKHGLLVRNAWRSGLLLPQVAAEWGWDRETFLAHTCQKAGLPGNCWQEAQTQVFWFQAEVF